METVNPVMLDELTVDREPFYVDSHNQIPHALGAYEARIPILLRGPTGCGKTRFMERLVWEIDQHGFRASDTGEGPGSKTPLMTVACHEDLTSGDLVGRYVLQGESTVWMDGPLTTAVRHGAICYLDELAEARRDTTVVVHAVTDYRRMLPIERLGTVIRAHPSFLLVASHNPASDMGLRLLRDSTAQRFMTIDFSYPDEDVEAEILVKEGGIHSDLAASLVKLGVGIRRQQLAAGSVLPSTRLLVHAAKLVHHGESPVAACEFAVIRTIATDASEQEGMIELARALLPE
ncbi:MAG: AAA domain-containing protein [Actinobacteria bacterium]|nr:AAA domain-containing protein [Actinomycetota bacterium]